MPLEIIRDDITKVKVDAIVNAANKSLLGGGGVDGAIHRSAGPGLLEECKTLGGCQVGQAKITKGYNLPAKYVIHTVGPVWHGGRHNEEKMLEDCYRNSLELAKEHELESIAFPLISSGAYGYPKDEALRVAMGVIEQFLLHNEMKVIIVVYDNASFMMSKNLFESISQYIDDVYSEQRISNIRPDFEQVRYHSAMDMESKRVLDESTTRKGKRKLEDLVNHVDETFSQMLLRLIDEKGLSDSQTYKKANIDRKLFSKIRNDVNYKPSKGTAIAFSIALELNLDDTRELLLKAGFALSRSSKFDIIIEYFIDQGDYNIFTINEALFAFDQNLLGV